jgi:hypothetical protein
LYTVQHCSVSGKPADARKRNKIIIATEVRATHGEFQKAMEQAKAKGAMAAAKALAKKQRQQLLQNKIPRESPLILMTMTSSVPVK